MSNNKKVVLSVEEFQEMVDLIKKLKEANKALNEQIEIYNAFAKEVNISAGHDDIIKIKKDLECMMK